LVREEGKMEGGDGDITFWAREEGKMEGGGGDITFWATYMLVLENRQCA